MAHFLAKLGNELGPFDPYKKKDLRPIGAAAPQAISPGESRVATTPKSVMHSVTINELSLIDWANKRFKHNKQVAEAVENFIRRKSQDLSCLSTCDMNFLKMAARNCCVSLEGLPATTM